MMVMVSTSEWSRFQQPGTPGRGTFVAIRTIAWLLPLVFFSSTATAQSPTSQRYWITFRDRGDAFRLDFARGNARDLGISDRALWRRAKVLPPDRLINELDLPVPQSYIDAIRSTGASIRSTSRWFNAVSAELSPDQRASIESLPVVASVSPVAVFFKKHFIPSPGPVPPPLLKRETAVSLDYGPSLTQLSNIKVVDVHDRGINGAGVIVGMIDDGFNYHQTHPALKNIKVIAEYDFVQRDSNTSRASGEYYLQGSHGAATLSEIGGFENGKLIGVAYGASFILAKTEIDSVEIRVEEDLYVEALEWMESLGVDIVSSSLGYSDWYTWPDMDGKTATTSKAARVATRKGVLVVTAMGNAGLATVRRPDGQFALMALADADSIVAVGATLSDATLASFSLTGPTYDGRVKPEIVAQGVNVFAVSGDTGYTPYFGGTSASTPLAAGVAALILSANPRLTPVEVRARMLNTARHILDGTVKTQSYPNNFYGWGMVDAAKAVGLSGESPIPDRFVLHNNYPNPFNGTTTIIVDAPSAQVIEVAIYTVLGQRVRTLFKGYSTLGENRFFWRDGLDEKGDRVASGVYICRLQTPTSITSTKVLFIK